MLVFLLYFDEVFASSFNEHIALDAIVKWMLTGFVVYDIIWAKVYNLYAIEI